jgi:hypothetical protein
MHGELRSSFMLDIATDDAYAVAAQVDAELKAVHTVTWQKDGAERIVRTIKPNYEFSFISENHLSVDLYHDALRERLIATARKYEIESLVNFKHILSAQIAPGTQRRGFRYELPGDIPVALINELQKITIAVPEKHQRREKAEELTFTLAVEPHITLPFRSTQRKDPVGILSEFVPFTLHYEQEYLQGHSVKNFSVASTTCEEKLSLLDGWSIDSIISAQYFTLGEKFVAVIGPRMKDVQREKLLSDIGLPGAVYSRTPDGMERGTCTPFIRRSVACEIEKIVLLDLPEQMMAKPADYSLGGYGPSAHRASVHISPAETKTTLQHLFGNKIMSYKHPYQSYWL